VASERRVVDVAARHQVVHDRRRDVAWRPPAAESANQLCAGPRPPREQIGGDEPCAP
jgi:hypothetical protein